MAGIVPYRPLEIFTTDHSNSKDSAWHYQSLLPLR